MICSKKPFGLSTLGKVSIAIEYGQYDYARTLLENKWLNLFAKIKPGSLLNIKEECDVYKEKYVKNDSYTNYIRGKTVIILGPGAGEISIPDNEEELLFVALNYTGRNQNGSEYKVDVSYYSYATGDEVFFSENADLVPFFLNELKAIVLKGVPSIRRLNELKKYANVIINEAYTSSMGVMFGAHLMVPWVLYDLLLHGAKKIYITNVNMYSTKVIYNNKYSNEVTVTDESLAGMSVHNVFQNFHYLKSLYNAGLIDGDNVFVELMKMTGTGYARLMEKTHYG